MRLLITGKIFAKDDENMFLEASACSWYMYDLHFSLTVAGSESCFTIDLSNTSITHLTLKAKDHTALRLECPFSMHSILNIRIPKFVVTSVTRKYRYHCLAQDIKTLCHCLDRTASNRQLRTSRHHATDEIEQPVTNNF